MNGMKLSMFFACAALALTLTPQSAGAQPIFNVASYGADPAPSTADDVAVHQAFCDAMAASGTLFFPAGQWDLTNPLDLSAPSPSCTAALGRVAIQGVGRASLVQYVGSADAAIRSDSLSGNAQFTSIQDLSLRGTGNTSTVASPIIGLLGQSGIALVAPKNVTIARVVLERFDHGYGIFLKLAVSCTVTDNQIGGSQVAIALRTPNDVEVAKNSAATWANAGILLFSDPNDAVTTRNNVHLNVIQGASLVPQDVPQSRAGIKVDSVSSTEIENNTIHKILAPSGYAGHGIWLTRTTTNLNQSNAVRDNYLGPGTQGDGIRIADGLVSHALIEGNNLGAYTIRDDGVATIYQLQYLADLSQLTGTPSQRRGWVGLPTSVVQLH